MNDLAIVLINWNGKSLLSKTLPSLPNDTETWIVDNGSVDGSVTWIKENYPKINVIENKENLGFGKANNLALKSSTKPFVLMLNNDAKILNECLDEVVSWLKNNLHVGLVGAQLLNLDGSHQNSVTAKIDLLGECTNRRLINFLRNEQLKRFSEPTQVKGVIGAAMLARREALDLVNYFDEDYFFFFEETDLCTRLRKSNWEIWHYPNFQVEHTQGQTARKNKEKARIEFHRSREIYFYKHYGPEASKTLHLWQERRLYFTEMLYSLGYLFSLGLWNPPRRRIIQKLRHWYRLGCPDNYGLKPNALC